MAARFFRKGCMRRLHCRDKRFITGHQLRYLCNFDGLTNWNCHVTRSIFFLPAQSCLQIPLTRIGLNRRDCLYSSSSSKAAPLSLGGHEDDKITTKQILSAMLSYVWPKKNIYIKTRVVGAASLLIISKLLNASVPLFFKAAVDQFTTDPIAHSDMLGISFSLGTALLLGYGAARTGVAICNDFHRIVFARVAQNSIRRIAKNVFDHLHSLDLAFHLQRQTGSLSKIIDRGSRGTGEVLRNLVFNIFPTALEIALVIGILYYKCGIESALIGLGFVGSYAAFTISITLWRTKFRHDMNNADNQAGNLAVDSLINYETVKYFNNEKYESQRYDAVLSKYEEASLKTTTSLYLLNFGQNLIITGTLTLMMLLAGNGIMSGTLTVGDLVLVNGLIMQLSIPLNFLGSTYRDIRQAFTDMENMFKLLNLNSNIKEKKDKPPLVICPQESSVTFEDVYFGYEDGKPIFNGLSFSIPTGKKVAIVGGSGSGKSTLVRLLYRFYDPISGQILINGQNIQDVQLDSLRNSIGVVPQDCVLFHNTIYYNIKYGNTKASDEEIEAATKFADMYNTVMSMPHGYSTTVGERGLKLSGGEKQRIAIARTLLKDPPIILFDEATSSLDSLTELNIMESLNKMAKGKTSLFIAHRLSTISNADEILVLDKGQVKERGKHYELLSQSGSLYSQLWKSQLGSIKELC